MLQEKLTLDLRNSSLSERVEFLKDLLAIRVRLQKRGVHIKMKKRTAEDRDKLQNLVE